MERLISAVIFYANQYYLDTFGEALSKSVTKLVGVKIFDVLDVRLWNENGKISHGQRDALIVGFDEIPKQEIPKPDNKLVEVCRISKEYRRERLIHTVVFTSAHWDSVEAFGVFSTTQEASELRDRLDNLLTPEQQDNCRLDVVTIKMAKLELGMSHRRLAFDFMQFMASLEE